MHDSRGQGELFDKFLSAKIENKKKELEINSEVLKRWQQRVQKFQHPFFIDNFKEPKQSELFPDWPNEKVIQLNPLRLTPLPLNFWRWPNNPHQGPAIYLVMDRPEHLTTPLLLYVGETIAADRRWKGNHDCKTYLNAYSEALVKADLPRHLSIRFWTDVPKQTKERRALEQNLIQRWLPPFNKETRSHWSTPFTTFESLKT